MSKGSKPRPFSDRAKFDSEFDRIFGKQNMGCSSTAEQDSLTVSVVSSNLTAPAIYIDNCTGRQVNEDWWPGDSLPEQS